MEDKERLICFKEKDLDEILERIDNVLNPKKKLKGGKSQSPKDLNK